MPLDPKRCWRDPLNGPIAGVDEVGRGPLAGPVVAAAVIWPHGRRLPNGLDDSKALSREQRESLYDRIIPVAAVGIGMASREEIDQINIYHATMLAMCRAVRALPIVPRLALIDGNATPRTLECEAQTVVGGDAICGPIMAASVVAKVTRDRMMLRLAEEHPHYGWCSNVGYSTKAHLQALVAHGATEHHRRSFAPVRQVLGLDPVQMDLVADLAG